MDNFFATDATYLADTPYLAPEIRPEFQCVAVAVHPRCGQRRAFGFWRAGNASPWLSRAMDDNDWAKGWTEMHRSAAAVPLPDYDDGLQVEVERLRCFAEAAERRHEAILGRLAQVDAVRDGAAAWDLGMSIVALLDGPVPPLTPQDA